MIEYIENHKAYLCVCGSCHFNLLQSNLIECAKCGDRFGHWSSNMDCWPPERVAEEHKRFCENIKLLVATADKYKELYFDLIYQVQRKFKDESRHETAKRYINNQENQITHEESEKCWCEPVVEEYENGNKLVIHNEEN